MGTFLSHVSSVRLLYKISFSAKRGVSPSNLVWSRDFLLTFS